MPELRRLGEMQELQNHRALLLLKGNLQGTARSSGFESASVGVVAGDHQPLHGTCCSHATAKQYLIAFR